MHANGFYRWGKQLKQWDKEDREKAEAEGKK